MGTPYIYTSPYPYVSTPIEVPVPKMEYPSYLESLDELTKFSTILKPPKESFDHYKKTIASKSPLHSNEKLSSSSSTTRNSPRNSPASSSQMFNYNESTFGKEQNSSSPRLLTQSQEIYSSNSSQKAENHQSPRNSNNNGQNISSKIGLNLQMKPSTFPPVRIQEPLAKGQKKGLSNKQLSNLLKKHLQFPSKYRADIWAHILSLPLSSTAFGDLSRRGFHPGLDHVPSVYPIRDKHLSTRFHRVLSMLAFWSPVCADVGPIEREWEMNVSSLSSSSTLTSDMQSTSLHHTSPTLSKSSSPSTATLSSSPASLSQHQKKQKLSHVKSQTPVVLLSHHVPVCTSFYPSLVFPFVKLLEDDHLCLEVLITLTSTLFAEWMEKIPALPVAFLTKGEMLLEHFDSELSSHFHRCAIPPVLWLWKPMQCLYSECFSLAEWAMLMDHVLFMQDAPEKAPFLLCVGVAYVIEARSLLLELAMQRQFETFFTHTHPLSVEAVIRRAYMIYGSVPSSLLLGVFAHTPRFEPLPAICPRYPPFERYNRPFVQHELNERARARLEEEKVARRVADVEAKALQRDVAAKERELWEKEAQAARDAKAELKNAEKRRIAALKDEKRRADAVEREERLRNVEEKQKRTISLIKDAAEAEKATAEAAKRDAEQQMKEDEADLLAMEEEEEVRALEDRAMNRLDDAEEERAGQQVIDEMRGVIDAARRAARDKQIMRGEEWDHEDAAEDGTVRDASRKNEARRRMRGHDRAVGDVGRREKEAEMLMALAAADEEKERAHRKQRMEEELKLWEEREKEAARRAAERKKNRDEVDALLREAQRMREKAERESKEQMDAAQKMADDEFEDRMQRLLDDESKRGANRRTGEIENALTKLDSIHGRRRDSERKFLQRVEWDEENERRKERERARAMAEEEEILRKVIGKQLRFFHDMIEAADEGKLTPQLSASSAGMGY
ncbi:Tre-2/Bub2/Cdc16 (TBC) L family protein A [Monocercomonoides exilis]|uniref:Tre-2/Bub2/Cdc16 (TBC) L family protein A n=1 Tax=Monocercomonoides exilis TaxID=2049356 RepID=UPI003559E519|nr:Tre-2/Bub2/Cdc16 (TBC) L family protein A [Monocercomonoides exilis]|eukprot:MONOS_9508.1-p1 / transcript=MONOS_9508.1 / gene=MONOS_9508 / organism=Monocercomonoides_exilis_PA203 / gene_product=Tre-2/Bub2/Cdc16 (TBC) L family protein A / transcript_product=Tre-2/Bub2/Cdc16 (TBC) L family protein A / location=Mono_scaffold00395:11726-14660(-) / protein_length=957 / sequence_SO=supercontig / SO=protein_coding / is_pseudo=false